MFKGDRAILFPAWTLNLYIIKWIAYMSLSTWYLPLLVFAGPADRTTTAQAT